MAVRLCTGFEFGTTAGWTVGQPGCKFADAVVGTPTIASSAPVRSGTYALELSPTGAAESILWDTNTLAAAQTRSLTHFAFQFPTLPAAGTRDLGRWLPASGVDLYLYFDSSDDTLRLGFGAAPSTNAIGPVIAAGVWYVIEVYQQVSGATHTYDWWVNGAAQPQASKAAAASTVGSVMFGTILAETYTARIDDLVVWTDTAAISAPVGNHKVVMLLPGASSATTQIGTANATARMVTNSAIDATHVSADIRAALRDLPFVTGASASGLGQRTAGATNACGVVFETYTLAAGETLAGLRIEIPTWAANATAAANTLGVRVHNGTVEDILFAAGAYLGQNTAAPSWICKMCPAGNYDTQAELDALMVRVGYSADIAPLPGIHAIYVEVAVKASAAVGGAARTDQRATTQAAGGRVAAGPAQADQRAGTAAAGLKRGPAAAQLAQRTLTQATSGRLATRAAQADQRTGTAGAGLKRAPAAAQADQRTLTAAAGLKRAQGAASAAQRTGTQAAGRRLSPPAAAQLTQRTGTAAAGQKTAQGAASAAQRTGTSSAGAAAAPGASGAAQLQQRTSTAAAGRRLSVPAAASAAQRTSTAATGQRTAAAAAQLAQRTSTAAAGRKLAPAPARAEQRTAAAATGRKLGAPAGAGPLPQRTGTTAAGRKLAPPAAAQLAQRSSTQASTATGGPARTDQRTATAAAGRKLAPAAAQASQRSSSRASGQRAPAVAAALLAQRTATAAAGRKLAAAAPTVVQRSGTATAAARRGGGPALLAQRTATQAAGGPPPAPPTVVIALAGAEPHCAGLAGAQPDPALVGARAGGGRLAGRRGSLQLDGSRPGSALTGREASR